MNKFVKGLGLGLLSLASIFAVTSCKTKTTENVINNPQFFPEDITSYEATNLKATDLYARAVQKYNEQENITRTQTNTYNAHTDSFLLKGDIDMGIKYTDYVNGSEYFREEVVVTNLDLSGLGAAVAKDMPTHEYKKYYYDGIEENNPYLVYKYAQHGNLIEGTDPEKPFEVTAEDNYSTEWMPDQLGGEFDKTLEKYNELMAYNMESPEYFVGSEVVKDEQVEAADAESEGEEQALPDKTEPTVYYDKVNGMYYFSVYINCSARALAEEQKAVVKKLESKAKKLVFNKNTKVNVGIGTDFNLYLLETHEDFSGNLLGIASGTATSITSTAYDYADDALLTDEIIGTDKLPQATVVAVVNKKEQE